MIRSSGFSYAKDNRWLEKKRRKVSVVRAAIGRAFDFSFEDFVAVCRERLDSIPEADRDRNWEEVDWLTAVVNDNGDRPIWLLRQLANRPISVEVRYALLPYLMLEEEKGVCLGLGVGACGLSQGVDWFCRYVCGRATPEQVAVIRLYVKLNMQYFDSSAEGAWEQFWSTAKSRNSA